MPSTRGQTLVPPLGLLRCKFVPRKEPRHRYKSERQRHIGDALEDLEARGFISEWRLVFAHPSSRKQWEIDRGASLLAAGTSPTAHASGTRHGMPNRTPVGVATKTVSSGGRFHLLAASPLRNQLENFWPKRHHKGMTSWPMPPLSSIYAGQGSTYRR